MSYYVSGDSENFMIKKENQAAALLAIKNSNATDPGMSMSTKQQLQKSKNEVKTLSDIFDKTNYQVLGVDYQLDYDNDGNIIGLSTTDQEMDCTDYFLNIIAPYVEPGSIINWVGEDGDHWRWYFDGQTMHVQEPHLVYDPIDPINK